MCKLTFEQSCQAQVQKILPQFGFSHQCFILKHPPGGAYLSAHWEVAPLAKSKLWQSVLCTLDRHCNLTFQMNTAAFHASPFSALCTTEVFSGKCFLKSLNDRVGRCDGNLWTMESGSQNVEESRAVNNISFDVDVLVYTEYQYCIFLHCMAQLQCTSSLEVKQKWATASWKAYNDLICFLSSLRRTEWLLSKSCADLGSSFRARHEYDNN